MGVSFFIKGLFEIVIAIAVQTDFYLEIVIAIAVQTDFYLEMY
jgi:hypothetical protein